MICVRGPAIESRTKPSDVRKLVLHIEFKGMAAEHNSST